MKGEFRMTRRFGSLLLLCAAGAWAQRVERPITRSMVVDTPGSYILFNDLVAGTSQPALTVTASNVTIDLNGREISGPGANTGTGILVNGAAGVHIRNGGVRDFGFGVTVMNSNTVTIEDLHISGRGIAVSMPPPEVGIMIVNSKSVIVKHNNIFNVGLGIFVRGPGSMGNHIYGNTVTAGMNGLLGVCYNPAPGATGGPRGDTVERNAISGFRFAIQVNAGGPNVFKNNTLFYTMDAFEIAAGGVVQDVENTKVQLP
jgi:nitrous oxidase accessory protein NosD